MNKGTIGMFVLLMSMASAHSLFAMSDSDITKTISNKISSESSLSGVKIVVETNDGNVALQGNVNSDSQASMVTEIAQSIDGVRDVDTSQLKVKSSNQPFTDSFITAKIKGKFIQQKLFGDKDISAMNIIVETNNGVVTLSGTADDQNQIDNAIKIAKSVSGVKSVKSIIKLNNVP